jgi:PPOX class probable F420-dependent enzyme
VSEPITLAATARQLLDGPQPCVLTTLRTNGEPVSVVVWCDRAGDLVRINAGQRTAWLGRLRADPRASVTVVDTQNILRYIEIAVVVKSIEPDGDLVHMNGLSRVYYGLDDWPHNAESDLPRYRVTLRPQRVTVTDLPWPPGADRRTP